MRFSAQLVFSVYLAGSLLRRNKSFLCRPKGGLLNCPFTLPCSLRPGPPHRLQVSPQSSFISSLGPFLFDVCLSFLPLFPCSL